MVMSQSHHVRVSVSLPEEQVADLNFVAERLKMSRSALLATLVGESLPSLVTISSCIPTDPSSADGPDVARRLRGASADVLTDQISRMLKGDLFDG